ncbi:MAG: hypothetical protein LCH39_06840 [Proteobacteria bacterium]|nr:hypothetical protein [Pseudomonadota bacterium]
MTQWKTLAGFIPVRLLRSLVPVLLAVGLTSGEACAAGDFVSASGRDYGPFRTGLILMHLLGLVLGMGAALFLDIYMLRYLYRAPITPANVAVARLGGQLAGLGFAALCVSGVGFLVLYAGVAPGKLENPKMWAKVMVVALLMLNGMSIHERILPQLEASTGRPLLAGLSLREAFPFLMAGSLSIVGWMVALVLGAVREFNFVYPGQLFLGAFLVLFLLVLGSACILHGWMQDSPGAREAGHRGA